MIEYHFKKRIDELESEIELLKAAYSNDLKVYEKEIENLKTDVIDLLFANAKMKKALQKCSPYYSAQSNQYHCLFCNAYGHTDDCEYVRLTGGAE